MSRMVSPQTQAIRLSLILEGVQPDSAPFSDVFAATEAWAEVLPPEQDEQIYAAALTFTRLEGHWPDVDQLARMIPNRRSKDGRALGKVLNFPAIST